MPKIILTDLNNLQNESTVTAAINNNNTIIEAAVENSISRDGTQPNQMNSVLDMNSNKIINLPDGFTDQEPVTYGQFIDGITSVNQGVVVDGAFILAEHNDTTINDRVLVAGDNLQVIDGGSKGNFTVRVSDPELNALASTVSAEDKLPYFTGEGTADVADFTPYARTLIDDEDAETARATLGLVLDTDVQPHDPTLNSLVTAGNGIMTKTATNTITPRTVTGTSNEITVTNGNGVSGNPTVSLPNSLTFTGKTVTGGTFSSPTINTPTGITKSDVGLSNVDNTSDATKNSASATLINKTISGSDNTITNVPNASVVGLGSLALKNKATVPSDLSTTGTPDGTKFLRDDGQWTSIPGGGDLLSTNNLSDLANASTSLTNLGGTTVGKAVFTASSEASGRDALKVQKKNYIVNSAMRISQENGTVAGTTTGYYPADQWQYGASHDGTVSVAQVASVTPAGSPNRIRATVTVADTSIAAGQYANIFQSIEGVVCGDLLSGTASAKTITLKFGVKAPAGTYCISLRNNGNTRSYVAEYTISAGEANTDVYKTVTIALDQSGTWQSDTGIGIQIVFSLAGGSTYQTTAGAWASGNYLASSNQFNFLGTVSNVFELFDVGLYEGSVAPDFVVPDYVTELLKCQRYFEAVGYGGIWLGGVSMPSLYVPIKIVPKRVVPTSTLKTSTTNLCFTSGGGGTTPSSFAYGTSTVTDAIRAQLSGTGMAGVSFFLTHVNARM